MDQKCIEAEWKLHHILFQDQVLIKEAFETIIYIVITTASRLCNPREQIHVLA